MNKSSSNSLAHTRWECKYHIVFAPKYRRQIIYRQLRKDIGKILRDLCERKGVEIIEAECCPDHIHMLVRIPPKYSVSEIMGYLKGKSSLIIFDRHANLKYKYGNRHFWCRGYYVDTVGKNAKKIQEYIQKQLEEDKINDQITLKEYIDPFTGKPENINKQKDCFSRSLMNRCVSRIFSKRSQAFTGNNPLQGQSKPPAKRVVLTKYKRKENTK